MKLQTRKKEKQPSYVKVGPYLVFKSGRIWSVRAGAWLKGTRHKSRASHYMRLKLGVGGRVYRPFVHQIVALAFHGIPKEGQQVNHIDGNTLNNRADNLEWVTAEDNLAHAILLRGLLGSKEAA